MISPIIRGLSVARLSTVCPSTVFFGEQSAMPLEQSATSPGLSVVGQFQEQIATSVEQIATSAEQSATSPPSARRPSKFWSCHRLSVVRQSHGLAVVRQPS